MLSLANGAKMSCLAEPFFSSLKSSVLRIGEGTLWVCVTRML